MRIGIATKNGTQAGIMVELLQPLFGEISVYDDAALESGQFSLSNDHIIIIDYSVSTIMDMDCILEMLDLSLIHI